jgi:hypothetical protein
MPGHQRNFPRQNVSEGGQLREYAVPFLAVSTLISIVAKTNTDSDSNVPALAHSAF